MVWSGSVSMPAGELRVLYRFTEWMGERDLEDLGDVLSPSERERRDRFVFARDRRDFAAAHALVRGTLAQYGGLPPSEWRFATERHGKPVVVAEQSATLAFNLSHTHGLVACAVARGTDVGVDVEAIEDSNGRREIADRYFSKSEMQQLDACTAAEFPGRFVDFWTLKESYIKAIGTGLQHPLDSFSFALGADGGIGFEGPDGEPPQSWQFALIAPAPRYRLAVAVRCTPDQPRYRITFQDVDA